jgi:hypothetical protein
MKRLLFLLLLLALPALADELSETKLSVDYENAAFTDVLADIESKMNAAVPEYLRFTIRLDRSVTNELPAITFRADEIALEELVLKLDALTGLYHAGKGDEYLFLPPPRNLEEAVKRFLYYRPNGEWLSLCAIETVADADGGMAWLFTCKTSSWGRHLGTDGEEPEKTETVVRRVDSSGKVDELSREPAEKSPFPSFWPPHALNYCRATGIDPDSLSKLSADAETNMVFVVGNQAPFRVSRLELARAEKAYFFKTIAEADRIVVRDGGFDCCVSEEAIDRQPVIAVLTNAADVAAFTAMIRFEDGPAGGFLCMCCGHPGIDWWKGGERLALTSVQHGRALRWHTFSDDYPFTAESAESLARWFEDRGIPLK